MCGYQNGNVVPGRLADLYSERTASILSLWYGVFAYRFFLDTHGNTISSENLNSGLHENYVMFKTLAAVFNRDLKPRGAALWF